MIYCLENRFDEPIKSYHWNLVEEVSLQFPSLTWTKEQKLGAHFTLKYKFETDDILQLETILDQFAKTHVSSSVNVGGFDHFDSETVFIKVDASREARKTFGALIEILKLLPWMQWKRYDEKGLHFHMTIAEKCEGLHKQVLEFLKGKEQNFNSQFDNVTILQLARRTPSGMELWQPYRQFKFK